MTSPSKKFVSLFFTTGELGHEMPLLTLAHNFTQKPGSEVHYYSLERSWNKWNILKWGGHFHYYLNEENFSFRELAHKVCKSNGVVLEKKSWFATGASISVGLMDFLVNEITRLNADVVIYDAVCAWAMLAAKKANVPYVCSSASTVVLTSYIAVHTEAQSVAQLPENAKSLQILKDKYGLEYDVTQSLTNYSPMTVLWSLPELMDPKVHLEERKETSFKFHFGRKPSGLSAVDIDFPIERLQARKKDPNNFVVYFSLGTVASEAQIPHGKSSVMKTFERFLKVVQKFSVGKKNVMVVMSTCYLFPFEDLRHQVLEDFKKNSSDASQADQETRDFMNYVDSHVWGFSFVPQTEVLSQCDLFVTNGGHNSVMESIAAAVPMLVIPVFGDQIITADAIERLKIGVSESHGAFWPPNFEHATEEKLKESFEKAYNSIGELKTNVKKVCDKLAEQITWFDKEALSEIQQYAEKAKSKK